MTTITTINLSWSVNYSIGYIDTCVSNTSEQSSVFDEQKRKKTHSNSLTPYKVFKKGEIQWMVLTVMGQ